MTLFIKGSTRSLNAEMKLSLSLGIFCLLVCDPKLAFYRLTKLKDLVIESHESFEVFVVLGVFYDPFVSPEKPRRIRFDILADRNALHAAHHLLTFFRQAEVIVKPRRVGMR